MNGNKTHRNQPKTVPSRNNVRPTDGDAIAHMLFAKSMETLLRTGESVLASMSLPLHSQKD